MRCNKPQQSLVFLQNCFRHISITFTLRVNRVSGKKNDFCFYTQPFIFYRMLKQDVKLTPKKCNSEIIMAYSTQVSRECLYLFVSQNIPENWIVVFLQVLYSDNVTSQKKYLMYRFVWFPWNSGEGNGILSSRSVELLQFGHYFISLTFNWKLKNKILLMCKLYYSC